MRASTAACCPLFIKRLVSIREQRFGDQFARLGEGEGRGLFRHHHPVDQTQGKCGIGRDWIPQKKRFGGAVMAEYFSAPYPARSTIEVAGLPKGVPFEVDAILVLG